MRLIPTCPGLWYYKIVPFVYSPAFRVLCVSLAAMTCIFIVLFTIVETHTLWRQSRQVQLHELANKKYSVAMATDVENEQLHYGIVIDCGSSGSRLFVYFWPPHDGNPDELLNIQQMRDQNAEAIVMKVEPGLSSFASNPSAASDYMRPLLQYAANQIPTTKHKSTPLYILATAGLRMLEKSDQDAILDDLRQDIPKDFAFQLSDTYVEVISGKQEGIYAWIAINYVLGKFNHVGGGDPLDVVSVPGDDKPHVRKRTVGMIDMGGGSLQIAFEVPKYVKFFRPKDDHAANLLSEFSLGCSETDLEHKYRVYVTTFLGFGGNVARTRYENMVINTTVGMTFDNTTSIKPGETELSAFRDPCLPIDMMQTADRGNKRYYFRGTGDFLACQHSLKPLLGKDVPCEKKPCGMDGVYQPNINFVNSEFYGFSEFYYTTEDVLRMSGKYDYMKFMKAASEYCATPWTTLLSWYNKNLFPKANERRFKMQCFKSAWIATVLHDGFGFPRTYDHFTSTQLIDHKEVQWTLGALLYKTRYYPLREIEHHHSPPHRYRPPWELEVEYTTYVFALCIVIVLAAILLYLCRLRVCVGRRQELRKVPTMAYFMTDPGQVEEGVNFERDEHKELELDDYSIDQPWSPTPIDLSTDGFNNYSSSSKVYSAGNTDYRTDYKPSRTFFR